MSLTGPADGDPYRLGVAIADIAAGMFAAQGITLALLVRERTGKGQFVDVGMLDSVASLLTYQAGIYFTTGRTPTRMGNRHPSIAPYDTLAAEDGTLVLAVGNDGQWRTFCQVAGLTSPRRRRALRDQRGARRTLRRTAPDHRPPDPHAQPAGVDRQARARGRAVRRGAGTRRGADRSAACRA